MGVVGRFGGTRPPSRPPPRLVELWCSTCGAGRGTRVLVVQLA